MSAYPGGFAAYRPLWVAVKLPLLDLPQGFFLEFLEKPFDFAPLPERQVSYPLVCCHHRHGVTLGFLKIAEAPDYVRLLQDG